MKMKKFTDFLSENIRHYFYTVRLAFKPDHDLMNKIEQALGKYTVVSVTAPRSLPIQRNDQYFPGINSPETYIFEVEVAYPAPAEFVRHTIASLGLELEKVVVVSTEHMQSTQDEDAAVAKNTGDHALLDSPLAAQDNAQISAENFGDEYNEKLVKNSIGSTDQMIPKELKGRITGHTTDNRSGETLNDPKFKVGVNSAVGSHQNKMPKPKSFGPRG